MLMLLNEAKLRYPTIYVNQLVAQLISFPMGRLWARFMFRATIFGIPLNPGPFTIKEHVRMHFRYNPQSENVFLGPHYDNGWCWLSIRLCGKSRLNLLPCTLLI